MGKYLTDLVRISDTLTWEAERARSYIDAVHIIQVAVGAHMAPSFLLDDTGTQLVLVADETTEKMLRERGFGTMPAIEHVRAPWINDREWPVSAADHLEHESWRMLPQEFKDWFGTSGIVVSIHATGRHLGAVLLVFDHAFRMTAEQSDFLAAAGRILGVAVHRWQSAGRERELGALDERRRLGDELHADLSQQVATLSLHAEALRLDAEGLDAPHLCDDIQILSDLVSAVQENLRHQMLGLRFDADLADVGLLEKIKQHIKTFQTRTGIPVTFNHTSTEPENDVPLAVAVQFLRVLQESLGNTHLHAKASHVRVTLRTTRTHAQLMVEDDGVGFTQDMVQNSQLGLRIMHERMDQIGGTLRIDSSPGRGTRVIAVSGLNRVQPLMASMESGGHR